MRNIVCIDIGGTSIKSAAIDVLSHRIIRQEIRATDVSGDFSTLKDSICAAIEQVLDSGSIAVAVSSAGDVDPIQGKCVYATDNLPGFTGFLIAKYITDQFMLDCVAINDGHAALLGEMTYGAGKGLDNVAMITLGTGVGGAFYSGGIVFGEDCKYGRFGHLQLYKNGIECNCGREGCVEQYISATALVKLANAKGFSVANGQELFSLDCDISEVISEYAGNISNAIEVISAECGAKSFIIGGGITAAQTKFLPQVEILSTSCKIFVAQLGNNAGLYGAYRWYNIMRG